MVDDDEEGESIALVDATGWGLEGDDTESAMLVVGDLHPDRPVETTPPLARDPVAEARAAAAVAAVQSEIEELLAARPETALVERDAAIQAAICRHLGCPPLPEPVDEIELERKAAALAAFQSEVDDIGVHARDYSEEDWDALVGELYCAHHDCAGGEPRDEEVTP